MEPNYTGRRPNILDDADDAMNATILITRQRITCWAAPHHLSRIALSLDSFKASTKLIERNKKIRRSKQVVVAVAVVAAAAVDRYKSN